MDKIEVLRNKMVLDCLTISDLWEITNFRPADICLGLKPPSKFSSKWSPICKTRVEECDTTPYFGKRGFSKCLEIFVDYFEEESEIIVPVDCPVKIKENLIFVDMTSERFNVHFRKYLTINLLEKNIFEKLNFR